MLLWPSQVVSRRTQDSFPHPTHKWCYQPGNASIAELKHFRHFKPKVEVTASTFFQGLEEKKGYETFSVDMNFQWRCTDKALNIQRLDYGSLPPEKQWPENEFQTIQEGPVSGCTSHRNRYPSPKSPLHTACTSPRAEWRRVKRGSGPRQKDRLWLTRSFMQLKTEFCHKGKQCSGFNICLISSLIVFPLK